MAFQLTITFSRLLSFLNQALLVWLCMSLFPVYYICTICFCPWNSVLCAQLLGCAQLLCNPMDWSPPGSSLHGILQARILEWVAISLSGNPLDPGMEPTSLESLALKGRLFTTSTTWEAQEILVSHYFLLSTVQISFCHKYFSDHTSQLWIFSLLNFQHIFSFHFGMWQTRKITECTWINGTISEYGGFFRL